MSEHISQKRMKAYVTSDLSSSDRAEVDAHLRTCSSCRNRMLDEGAPLSEEELFPKRLLRITIAALVVLLVVAVGGLFWWMRTNMTSSSPQAAGTTAPDTITIRDGNGAMMLSIDGRLESTFPIPQEYQKTVADALTSKRIPVTHQVEGLAKGYPLSQKRNPGEFRLLSPIGTAVVKDQPELAWESLPDAMNYTVTITEAGKVAATSPPLIDTRWETTPLRRGVVYEWQVVANRGGERVQSATMPGGKPAFVILEESTARNLDQLARAHPTEHLLIAVAFAGAGAIDRADDELRILVRNNPQIYFLRELAANLRPGIEGPK